jgi:hypothetical protein
VYARGSDGWIYAKVKNAPGGVYQGFFDWTKLSGTSGANSDPAATAWSNGRVDVSYRHTDGNIRLMSWTSAGGWTTPFSVGKPTGGAFSAPAITTYGSDRIAVFVGSGDGLYWKTCIKSGSVTCTSSSGWGSWAQVPGVSFLGKPAVTSTTQNGIHVAVHGLDHQIWTSWFDGSWHGFYVPTPGTTMWYSGSTVASPAITNWGPNRVDIFFRGQDSRLWRNYWSNTTGWAGNVVGGMIGGNTGASDGEPATVNTWFGGPQRHDIIVPNLDHSQRGVWWKFYPYTNPCLYDATCPIDSECACGGPGEPPCVRTP